MYAGSIHSKRVPLMFRASFCLFTPFSKCDCIRMYSMLNRHSPDARLNLA